MNTLGMMKRGCFLILMLTVTTLGSGCVEEIGQPEDYEDMRVHREEIRGGSFDTENSSVVGLVSLQGGFGICTGSLIAPNLVLTAQHCIASLNSEFVVCGQTRFGSKFRASNVLVTTQPQMTQDGRDYYAAAEIHVPPGDNDVCGNDIALLVLSGSIPATEARPLIPRVDTSVFAGEGYTSVGYGHTGNGGGSGVRRLLGNRTVQCDGPRCPSFSTVADTEFLGDDGTCQGDSGGPALDVEGRVLGALSRGPNGCAGSVYSGVFGWSDWIRDIGVLAADRGGYVPPAWVTEGTSEPVGDSDGDGVADDIDNCLDTPNADQANADGDALGDACDPDFGAGDGDDGDTEQDFDDADQDDDADDGGGSDDEGFVDGDGFVDGEGFVGDNNLGFVDDSTASQASCATAPLHGTPSPLYGALALLLGVAVTFVRRRA